MSPRKTPGRKHGGRPKGLSTLLIVVSLVIAAYFLANPVLKFFSAPPRADILVLGEALDSAYASIEPKKISTSSVSLGRGELAQDRLELHRETSLFRANLEITRAVERAGGEVLYGIDSIDEKRRWQIVTLGISDGDSLICEVRLVRRIR